MIYCCKVYHEIIFQQIFDRSITWEDPTKWVILRYPWNKDHSRFLHTLRKLRQVDVVLNRNHLGSDNGEIILAPVVQTLVSAIHRINHYPADSVINFCNTYPLDSFLSGG